MKVLKFPVDKIRHGSARPLCGVRIVFLAALIATAVEAGPASAQLVTPLPPSPSEPAPPPAPAAPGVGTQHLPYGLSLDAPLTADPRKPVPLTIRLLDRSRQPALPPAGLVINLTVTTLTDLQQAKNSWAAEEISVLKRENPNVSGQQVEAPPVIISSRGDVRAWNLPGALSNRLLKDLSAPPPHSITLDFDRTTAFGVFQFPTSKSTVTIGLATSHRSSRLLVAVQAKGLTAALRTLTTTALVLPAPTAPTPDGIALAADNPTSREITFSVTRRDYRLQQGWWSYYLTASLPGVPPNPCYVDLTATRPLRFDDPTTGEPVPQGVRMSLSQGPDPTATATLETVEQVLPGSRPRKALINIKTYCEGTLPAPTAIAIDIPPVPHTLLADPASFSDDAYSGTLNVVFHVLDEQNVDMTPEMQGQETDGTWQVEFEAEPASAATVTPQIAPLGHGKSMTTAAIHWTGPGRVQVSSKLVTTQSPQLSGARVTLDSVFPIGPLILSVVAAALTQIPAPTRILPRRWVLCVAAGLAWGALAFWVWYAMGPVVQTVRLGPVDVGFSQGAISGSYWVGAVVIGVAIPLLIKIGLLFYGALKQP